MHKAAITMTIAGAAASLALATTANAQAKGDPQRSAEVPPGLAKALDKAIPGIVNALVATEGSNSRLEDAPVSP